MITVPNTLGVFEERILDIAKMVHDKGAFLYLDGANFNAFVGKVRPADMGVDVMHMNLHKTFSTPHGGGGPGAGPVGVAPALVPFLPVPDRRERGGGFRLDFDRPDSIGRMRTFYGNFGVLVRALTYIVSYGNRIHEVAENAVLNANYIRKKLEPFYHLKYVAPTYHEVVFDDKKQAANGLHNIDVAKRLMDYGFHPPTMSFPLIVPGALMIEPTESEPKEELDAFIDAMIAIAKECEESPEIVHGAPYTTPVRPARRGGRGARGEPAGQLRSRPAGEGLRRREKRRFFCYRGPHSRPPKNESCLPDVRCQGSSTASRRAQRALDTGHPGRILFSAAAANAAADSRRSSLLFSSLSVFSEANRILSVPRVRVAFLDGRRLARALVAGARAVSARREAIDRINVFPVADRDTGSNLSATLDRVSAALAGTRERTSRGRRAARGRRGAPRIPRELGRDLRAGARGIRGGRSGTTRASRRPRSAAPPGRRLAPRAGRWRIRRRGRSSP